MKERSAEAFQTPLVPTTAPKSLMSDFDFLYEFFFRWGEMKPHMNF